MARVGLKPRWAFIFLNQRHDKNVRTVFIHAYNNTRESDNGAPTFSFAIRRWIIKTHGRRHVEKHVCGSLVRPMVAALLTRQKYRKDEQRHTFTFTSFLLVSNSNTTFKLVRGKTSPRVILNRFLRQTHVEMRQIKRY